MAKRSSLGKNLDALLGQIQTIQTASQEKTLDGLIHLPVEYLSRSQYQPRKEFSPESLQELADSIRSQGIIQPIVVRTLSEKRYEIIAGERRWRAAQMVGLQNVPVIVQTVSNEAALAMALIENIQRENLSAIEEANALYRLQQEFALTHEEVAQTVGKSRTAVTNLIRLLQMETEVKRLLESQTLSFGHAKVLLALKGHQQVQAAKTVVSRELSVRATEQLVLNLQKPTSRYKGTKARLPDVRNLEEKISDSLGARVCIQQNSKGRGKLVIYYSTIDELDGIMEKFGAKEAF